MVGAQGGVANHSGLRVPAAQMTRLRVFREPFPPEGLRAYRAACCHSQVSWAGSPGGSRIRSNSLPAVARAAFMRSPAVAFAGAPQLVAAKVGAPRMGGRMVRRRCDGVAARGAMWIRRNLGRAPNLGKRGTFGRRAGSVTQLRFRPQWRKMAILLVQDGSYLLSETARTKPRPLAA